MGFLRFLHQFLGKLLLTSNPRLKYRVGRGSKKIYRYAVAVNERFSFSTAVVVCGSADRKIKSTPYNAQEIRQQFIIRIHPNPTGHRPGIPLQPAFSRCNLLHVRYDEACEESFISTINVYKHWLPCLSWSLYSPNFTIHQ